MPSSPGPLSRLRGRRGVRSIALALPFFVLLTSALLGAACSGGGDESAALDPFLCTQEDLGDGYQQLTDGSFSPGDLADLGPDAREREREFREAGMQRGKFVLFKQVLPKPPFEPPVNVVCQVLEFETADSARTWVENLQADDTIETTAIAWIPGDNRSVTQTPYDQGYPAVGVRTAIFEVHAGSGHEEMTAVYSSSNHGRLVFTVAVGSSGERSLTERYKILAAASADRALRLKDTQPPQ